MEKRESDVSQQMKERSVAKMSRQERALADLKAALHELKPSGAKGFEGLLAAILSEVAGRPFRLAKSGLQNGKDGATLAEFGQIAFEAKLYKGKLPDNEVLTKITRLIASASVPDIWFLGATVEASTQLLDPMEKAATKNGMALGILDWPDNTSAPPLAVACVAAAERTDEFFRAHVADAALVKRARAALKVLAKSEGIRAGLGPFRASLQIASIGMANAMAANEAWLDNRFSDRAQARAAFGQAVSPKAEAAMPHQSRDDLLKAVMAELMSKPSRRVIALVGGEGRGKTWLVANSWLQMSPRPLAVFVAAGDMKATAAYGEFSYFLISKIIQQTGDDDTDQTRARWQRKLKAWEDIPNGETPRFLVCVDGLNQQPRFEWPRWLDDAAAQVAGLGGVLIVTVRKTFFEEHLRRSSNTEVKTFDIPEWTSSELDAVLTEKGIDPSKLATTVHRRLRNPRILAIAFDLLDNAQIQNFTELSVERLLFEHIRAGARDGAAPESAQKFARRLSMHAQEILERVKSQQTEDRLIFDETSADPYRLSSDLMAVTAEHFFTPVDGEAGLYCLAESGLTLALGLALLSALRAAERNGREVNDELERVLEPVVALDRTADAVFASVMAASVDETCSNAIRSALITGFLSLQNIDSQLYAPFTSAVRNAPEAALAALEDAATTSRHIAQADWLPSSLRNVRNIDRCWDVISRYAQDWLRSYSLTPEIGLLLSARHEGPEAFEKKLADQKKKLKKRLKQLPKAERVFLERNMRLVEGDPAGLHRRAMELIAGRPLAPFAEPLVACAYSMALNSSYSYPYDEYLAVVRFNRIDWVDAASEMMSAAELLLNANASSTGRWARVQLMRALSREQDAETAKQLVDDLTADRERRAGWRLVEKYSASDPCDPSSVLPDNLAQTIVDYAAIDVAALTKSRSMGSEDHFFKDARPAMARFSPDTAVAKLREYANAVLDGSTKMRRLGITSLEQHNAALDTATASRFLEVAAALSAPRDPESQDASETWASAQFSLQIGLPHFDGDAQAKTLIALPPHGPPLVKLADVIRPASAQALEALLEAALASGESNRQLVALVFARHAGSPLTDRAREIVGDLSICDRGSVRAIAMDVVAQLDDDVLVRRIVNSGWPGINLEDRENKFEVWYGSLVMIAAAKRGLITNEQLLDRTTSELWGYAAQVVGAQFAQLVGARLRLAIATTVELELDFDPPVVLQRVPATLRPGLFELPEPEQEAGVEGFFARLNETDEEFAARQKKGWQNFKAFQSTLTPAQARIMVEDIGSEVIDAMVMESPADARALATILIKIDSRKRNRVANFAMRLAKGLSVVDPQIARDLFVVMAGETGYVRLTFGPAALSLESLAIWGAGPGADMDYLRLARLDDATSDDILAREVLAALTADRGDALESYVQRKLQSPVPADQARALMVLGFGLETSLADHELAKPTIEEGIISKAREAARYAYERNRWAKFWFEKMAEATTPEEFWRHKILFEKIVDARFELWEPQVTCSGSSIGPFGASISDQVRKRASNWASKREKTLCGDKIPSTVYSLIDV